MQAVGLQCWWNEKKHKIIIRAYTNPTVTPPISGNISKKHFNVWDFILRKKHKKQGSKSLNRMGEEAIRKEVCLD